MTPHRFIDLQGFGKATVSSETLVVDTHTVIWCHYPEYHDLNFPHHENLKFNAKSQLQNAFPFCEWYQGNNISAALHSQLIRTEGKSIIS
jgi:hypothetical protein